MPVSPVRGAPQLLPLATVLAPSPVSAPGPVDALQLGGTATLPPATPGRIKFAAALHVNGLNGATPKKIGVQIDNDDARIDWIAVYFE